MTQMQLYSHCHFRFHFHYFLVCLSLWARAAHEAWEGKWTQEGMTVVLWSRREPCSLELACSLEVMYTSLWCDFPIVANDYCCNDSKVLKALWEGLIQNLERLTGISD